MQAMKPNPRGSLLPKSFGRCVEALVYPGADIRYAIGTPLDFLLTCYGASSIPARDPCGL
jgi:hypothetical protein